MASYSGGKEIFEYFYDDAVPYTPRLDQLPFNDDVVRYYIIPMQKGIRQARMQKEIYQK